MISRAEARRLAHLRRMQKLGQSPAARAKAAITRAATMAKKAATGPAIVHAAHSPEARAKAAATMRANRAAQKTLNGKGKSHHAQNDIVAASTASRVLGYVEGYVEGFAAARGISGPELRAWVARGISTSRSGTED